MKVSHWLFIAAGIWLGVEVIAAHSQIGPSPAALQTAYAKLAEIDSMIPIFPNRPPYLPAGALALATAGAVARWGFGA